MKILVLNCGSSSIKFAVFNTSDKKELASGLVENIGADNGQLKGKVNEEKTTISLGKIDHLIALQAVQNYLDQTNLLKDGFDGIGHRVVHAGEKFSDSVLLTDEVLAAIESCNHLAPLHNPVNLLGIQEAEKLFPGIPQVGVFDTAFHQTMPRRAFIYPVPLNLYKEHGVRRYGFHGTSHRFVVERAAQMINKPLDQCAFISAHLGNGCSAAAVLNGKSIDTTMGLTPLEGLVMGTRSGNVDPGLHGFLAQTLKWDSVRIDKMLNKESGILGMSGISHDLRVIEKGFHDGDERCQIALEVMVYRLAQTIAALSVPLQRIDALIFTGGIGENSSLVRSQTLKLLKILNFNVDETKNDQNGKESNGSITTPDSTPAIVVQTNEELLIALDTEQIIHAKGK